METKELQVQLDAENLNFLNYILAKMFNVELQGYVYSEEDWEWAGFISCLSFVSFHISDYHVSYGCLYASWC